MTTKTATKTATATKTKQALKDMTVMVDGRHIVSCLTLIKPLMKMNDARHPILNCIRIEADAEGRYRLGATDTYKAVLIKQHGFAKAADTMVMHPDLAMLVKPSDTVYIDMGTGEMTLMRKGSATKHHPVPVDGKYPDIDRVFEKPSPKACYRYAVSLDAAYVESMMKAAKAAFGSNANVVMAQPEDETKKPIAFYANDENFDFEGIVMPCRSDLKMLGKERPKGKDANRVAELEKQLAAATANAEMWKAKAMDLEKKADAPKPPKAKPMAAKVEEAAKEKAGADVKATVHEDGGVTAVVIEPKRKTAKPKDEPKAPEKPKVEPKVRPTVEGLKAMFEASDVAVIPPKAEGACIWVKGDTKPYKEQLKEMGFKWSPKKKAWWTK